MSEAATTPAAAAPTTSTAENVTPEPAVPATPGGEPVTDSPSQEGAPAADPTKPVDPPVPTVDKLTKWSQKLNRREEKIRQQVADLEKRTAEQAALLETAKVFESKALKPIIETYAKKHGVSFEDAFNALTREVVAPGEKTVDEIVEEKLAKERQANAAQQQQARLQDFQTKGQAYIVGTIAASPHDYLKPYDPAYIANFAMNVALEQVQKTGTHEPLDKILADMNTAEKKRYDLQRQREAALQVPSNPERESGAVEPAKHEARKRNGTQLNNSHAAQTPSNGAGKEDLSDKALAAAAAKALRSIPGWH